MAIYSTPLRNVVVVVSSLDHDWAINVVVSRQRREESSTITATFLVEPRNLSTSPRHNNQAMQYEMPCFLLQILRRCDETTYLSRRCSGK